MRLELWKGSYQHLSSAQKDFAREVHAADFALPCRGLDGAYLYREANGWYDRWLVDSHGCVLEHVSFCERPHAPAESPS